MWKLPLDDKTQPQLQRTVHGCILLLRKPEVEHKNFLLPLSWRTELCYYICFSSNDKVFSSILGLSCDRAAWEVIQSRMGTRANPSCFSSTTEMQSDNLFLRIWSLLGWYLFWFPWRVQLCFRKTCGWKTFTINYFYANHMDQEEWRKSPLYRAWQRLWLLFPGTNSLMRHSTPMTATHTRKFLQKLHLKESERR